MSRLVIAVLCLAILLPASAAEAKSPPTGRYDCTISGITFGSVTIKGGNKYIRNGKTGKFDARGGLVAFPESTR